MKKKKKPVKRMVEIGLMNIVGTGMIGATASMHGSLPAGTAKTITGVVPGLQATALVGENLKAFDLPKQKRKRKRK